VTGLFLGTVYIFLVHLHVWVNSIYIVAGRKLSVSVCVC